MGSADTELERDYERLKDRMPFSQAGSRIPGLYGLSLSRREEVIRSAGVFRGPAVGFAVQGCGEAVLGTGRYALGRGLCLLDCVGLPGDICIDGGTGRPFLWLALELHESFVSPLLKEIPEEGERTSPEGAVHTFDMTPELLNAFLRLVTSSEHAGQAEFMGPLIQREILFLLLSGPAGSSLRRFYSGETPYRRIAQVAAHMRKHTREHLRMSTLEEMSGMAESTFNRKFRTLTGLSPLQFHKRLKLYEARRLMAAEHRSAFSACSAVGYESQQQFTREYRRVFGMPPMRDVKRAGSDVQHCGSPVKKVEA